MARETCYFVQAFNVGRGENLTADAPIACKTEIGALRTAERLASSKLGVVAFDNAPRWAIQTQQVPSLDTIQQALAPIAPLGSVARSVTSFESMPP